MADLLMAPTPAPTLAPLTGHMLRLSLHSKLLLIVDDAQGPSLPGPLQRMLSLLNMELFWGNSQE